MAPKPRNAGPFNWNVPITDPKTGRPTPEFLRKWAEQTNFNGSIGALEAAVAALQVLQIIAGPGLDGGGTLGGGVDITLELDADTLARLLPAGGDEGQVLTKVTGDDYDADWLDPTGGSGSGGYFNGATGTVNGSSTTLFATKGIVFLPASVVHITHIWAMLDPTAAAETYRAVLASVNAATGQIIDVLATSADLSTYSTNMGAYRFELPDMVELAPGTAYLLAIVNAAGSGVTVARVSTSAAGTVNSWTFNAPGLAGGNYSYNTIGLTASQAASTALGAGSYFSIWPEGLMVAEGWGYAWGMSWGL